MNLVLFTLCTITISTFIVAALLQDTGTFTIMAPREDMIRYGLILSDTPGFERPRAELRAAPVENMWNISQSDIPGNVDKKDSSHNGDDYLAYTFYLKNDGDDTLTYDSSITITEMYKAIDEAMRVKIYLNGTPKIYAKQKSDKSGNSEPDTIPFYDNTRIIKLNKASLKIGQVEKFTVVVWLEGDDPDCINSILGGSVKMTMLFTAIIPSAKPSSSSSQKQ